MDRSMEKSVQKTLRKKKVIELRESLVKRNIDSGVYKTREQLIEKLIELMANENVGENVIDEINENVSNTEMLSDKEDVGNDEANVTAIPIVLAEENVRVTSEISAIVSNDNLMLREMKILKREKELMEKENYLLRKEMELMLLNDRRSAPAEDSQQTKNVAKSDVTRTDINSVL